MITFLLNILLSLAWAALLGQFSTSNMIAGFILGYAALWVMKYVMPSTTYSGKIRQIVLFILFFLKELAQANLRMAYSVLTSFDTMRPGIIAIPLDVEDDAQITLLANLITLTPGTLSLDVSDDCRILYVHSIYVEDPESFIHSIKDGFERRIIEVTR